MEKGARKRWLRLNEVIGVGPIQSDLCPYKERKFGATETPGMQGHSKKAAMCRSRRDASGETKPVDTLTLDF